MLYVRRFFLATQSLLSISLVNGETTEKQKTLALERIEKDPNCRVLLMSIQAGGVGEPSCPRFAARN